MAILIKRSEALDRINKLEEKCTETGDKAGGEMLVKAFNAIMSCKVVDRVFCDKCGKPVITRKIPEDE